MPVTPEGQEWLQGVPPAFQAWASLFFAMAVAVLGALGYRGKWGSKPEVEAPDRQLQIAGALIDSRDAKALTIAINRVADALEREFKRRSDEAAEEKREEEISEIEQRVLDAMRREVPAMPAIRK